MATSFTVNSADLEFILRQIKIAEAHSGGISLTDAIRNEYGLSASDANLVPFGLRTVSGIFNNLAPGQEKFGAADTPFTRLLDPQYVNDTDGDFLDFNGNGVVDPGESQGNYQLPGNVIDADPRIITSLIANQTVDNPAAIIAWFNNPLALDAFHVRYGDSAIPVAPGTGTGNPDEVELDNTDIANIPNQSPDIGLSPGFNAWMTFFGQFFDHGLDLVTKSSNGTVYIPLEADDPLITHGPDGIADSGDEVPPHLAFMAVTRAKVDELGNAENTTTPFVDQNQTYTSHPSHQVFLREYTRMDIGDGAGMVTRSTGALLDGDPANGGVSGAPANWGETKAQALTMLGINLTDFDVHSAPLLKTDDYGEFVPGANGFAQLIMLPDATHPMPWLKEGSDDGSVGTTGAYTTGHQFLVDIAHHAVPGMYDSDGDHIPDMMQTADLDIGDPSLVADDHLASTYDNEMLDSHFVTGDGRGNENIALTAVHSVFHSEHNRLLEANKATLIEAAEAGDLALLNEWLLVDVASVPADHTSLVWDGERLFQAARFVTEMQYQHLVFEEFARRIQPAVDPFVFTHSPDVNAAIVAEFAHTVYRFGHSMLNDTVDRLDNNLQLVNGDDAQATLIEAFLNPQMFAATGADISEIVANIVRGATKDVGNEMDEFVVPQLQNNLLGLPLDLPAINIARGRENGIPSLNEARKQFYNDYGLADLKPYTSWIDFAQHIKNPASIINFIAAYGTHDTIVAATTQQGRRDAATDLLNLYASGDADAVAFLKATGAYRSLENGGTTNDLGGMNLVDFWIGGLAEELNEFGGMLGSTFNLVFEFQMEALQTGDRFYYLSRTQGTNLLNQLEPNTFTDLVMRNTDLSDEFATHLNGNLFVTPDHIFELDRGIAQVDYNPDDPNSTDPTHGDPFLDVIDPKVVRDYTGASTIDVPAGPGDYPAPSIANGSFEADSLADGAPNVESDPALGNYTVTAPTNWTITGQGGMFAPVDSVSDPAGHVGPNVVWLRVGAVLSQDTGVTLVENADYTMNFSVGDRSDGAWPGGTARLMASDGVNPPVEIAMVALTEPADGLWSAMSLSTGQIAGALAGHTLYIEIEQGDGSGNQILVDDISVTADYSGSVVTHDVGGYLKYSGGEHVVLGGTEGNDILIGDKGIDTLWGDGGNDYLNAGMESDNVFGGDGDDIIVDPFGDDVLRGDRGNDVISAGSGLDLIFGGEGSDYIIVGQDDKEAFGDEGDDFILGGTGNDFLLGGEGNDWIEGGLGFDVIAGENSELFFNSAIIGHDVAWGQQNDQDYDLESGDDIALSGPGIQRFEGMFGFDWAAAKYDSAGVNFDFQIPIFTNIPTDILKDRFDQVEAGSGWIHDDVLQGDDRGHVNGGSSAPDSVPVELFNDHILNEEGIDRIDGLRELLGGDTPEGGLVAMNAIFGTQSTTFQNGNILIGGGGSDVLRGRGGYDVLDGDAWLNVRIKIMHDGTEYSAESLNTDKTVAGPYAGRVYNVDGDGNPDFTNIAFGGRTLNSLMLDGTINPGSLSIVREIKSEDDGGVDTAVFQGTLAEYEIEGRVVADDGTVITEAADVNGDGFIRVRDMDTGSIGAVVDGVQLSSRGALTDDIDLLRNIEQLQFADQTIVIGGSNNLATGVVTINDETPFNGVVTPYVGQVLTATLSDFADADGIPLDPDSGLPVGLTYEWQTTEIGSNAGWTTIQTSETYTVRPVDPGHALRAVAVFDDANGTTERIYSASTDNPTTAYNVNENTLGLANGAALANAIVGLQIPFSVDYDAQPINGQPPADIDLTTLHHEIDTAHTAGGRFTVVPNGTDINGFARYSLVVDQGGSVLLDYEAPVHTPANQSFQFPDNQYQVVINTYDEPGGTLVAVRQFTILLNDVEPELVAIAPVLDLNGPDAGDGFTTAFTEDGPAVAIASSPTVTDTDPVLLSATIRLTNAEAGDALNVGALSPGMTSVLDTSVAGQITLTLVGTVSLGDYQAAIQGVTFSSNSQNPNPTATSTPRLIEVTVHDGQFASNVATTTINVIAPNDPVVANDDTIVTNIQGSAIVVPDWALLANDVDPDSVPSITGTANDVGVVSTHAAGSVSVIDAANDGGSFSYTASDGEFTSDAAVTVIGQAGGPGVSGNASDTFSLGNALDPAVYSGNNGTVNWSGPWVETGDNGASNEIRVNSGRLQMRRLDGGETVSRAVDLTGATNATVSFNFQVSSLESGENIVFEAFNGTTWDEVTAFNGTGVDGSAGFSQSGLFTMVLTPAQIGAHTAIRFRGEGVWERAGDNFFVDNVNIAFSGGGGGGVPGSDIDAGAGDQILVGDENSSVLDGGEGNDIIFTGAGNDTAIGGGGNDTIVWNADTSAGDGHDIVDGGADTDTFIINGNAEDETFRVYSRVAALAVATLAAAIQADAQIIITRNVDGLDPDAGDIIAQLNNVEEIIINTGPGTDTVLPIGDFDPTNLDYNTIRVNGGIDDDTVDISGLTSDHRVVLTTNGGNDQIVGGDRPQDTILRTNQDGAPVHLVETDGDGSAVDTDTEVTAPAGTSVSEILGLNGSAGAAASNNKTIIGTDASETLRGEDGNDMIFAGDGNDNALGGDGQDMIFGDGGNDRVFGEGGNDFLSGGLGNDMVLGGSGDDTFVAEAGDGNDSYYGDDVGGGSGKDTLDMSAITANITADLGNGHMERGAVYSDESGHDTIWNVENIVTGSGDDVITASNAVNVIDGGDGNDIFRFNSAAAADGDTIATFQPGDKIDLSGFDANGAAAGQQSFTLVSGAFTGGGQLMVTQEVHDDDVITVVSGNVTGGDEADFRINIKGAHDLTASDFYI